MPILWRYVFYGYLRVFCLSTFAFIAVLLVSRFKEIARFTALSGALSKTALFVLYQIPLILPIAIPISALIASLLLFQRLSRTFELPALRASGIGFTSILAPLLFAAALLSLLNFSFCATISPHCRRESKTLLYRETSSNPLLLMQRQNLVKIKHAYLNMSIKEEGRAAKDFTLIAHNESNQRLSLFSARKLRVVATQLLGYEVSIVSHLQAEKEDFFDPLIIENQASMSTSAPILSAALKKNRPHLEMNALGFRMLQIRSHESGKLAKAAYIEILRRLTLSLSVFSFTLLGCTFGIEQGRSPSRKTLVTALGLTLLVLVSYFLGKGLKTHPTLATLALLLPHPLIWIVCSAKLRQIAKGVLR